MTDLTINPQAARKADFDESMELEAIESLVHEPSRTLLLLVPLNASEFLKRTLQKSGFLALSPRKTASYLAKLEHDPGDWLCLSVVRDPVERAFAAYAENFLSAAPTPSAIQLIELFATINGASESCQPSSAGLYELSFRQYCQRLVSLRDEQLPQVFRSQVAMLPPANHSVWHVDYLQIPQMLMAVERRIGSRVSPKKSRNGYQRRALPQAESLVDWSADRLRQLNGIPQMENSFDANLTAAIRQRYRADWELLERASMSSARDATVQHVFSNVRQISSKTSCDRYPEIFRFAAQQLQPGDDRPKVLSLGCSTGEECQSLRKYFPRADICGIDLRAEALKKAQAANTDPRIEFHESTPQYWQSCGSFDAIFAMSVFCRWPETMYAEDCGALYRFDQFQSDLQQLDTHLQIGGLLVVYNANFRFDATDVSRNYESLIVPRQPESGFVIKFSSQNIRLAEQTMQQCVFRKIT